MTDAELIRASLPCSVELPAGCGKTETIANLVALVAADDERSLVLTHTHAGVDALRRRFRRLGVPTNAVTIRTIDSWCFDLIRSFPQLSNIVVDDEPDWRQSSAYYAGGDLAAATAAVQRMLIASYELLVVDEYQDCQRYQHELVVRLAEVVPTCVFGDRMQGLFFFRNATPVIWENDVIPTFAPVELPIAPWRWTPSNPALGAWLLDARTRLLTGAGIDLSTGPISTYSPGEALAACRALPGHPTRVTAIAKWPNDCALLARRLGYGFTMIEEIEGKHLLAFADILDARNPHVMAAGTLDFAVSCGFGVATHFDAACRRTLLGGGRLDPQRFGDASAVAESVNRVLDEPSPAVVRHLLRAIAGLPKFGLYRREAWYGMHDALRMAEVSIDLSVRTAVVNSRNKLRIGGRYPESRIIARPLLIKGLEFDHVVVTDPGKYNAHELYVCLTRGSMTVGVVSSTNVFCPARPY